MMWLCPKMALAVLYMFVVILIILHYCVSCVKKYVRDLISVEVFKIDLELIDSVVDNIGFSVYNFELDSAYNDLHLLAEDIIVSKLSGIG